MRLIRIICFIWCFPSLFGQCPTFYDLPCSVNHYTRKFEAQRSVFLKSWKLMDETIQHSCKMTGLRFPKLIMIWLKHQVEPEYCSITTICNTTVCMELGSPSNVFTEEFFIAEKDLDDVLHHKETKILNITHSKIIERPKVNSPANKTCDGEKGTPPELWDFPFADLANRTSINEWANAAEIYHKDYCKEHRIFDFTYYFDGILDFFCSHLVVCSYKKCILYSMTSQRYAKIFPIGSCSSNSYPDLPVCSAIKINTWPFGRRRRRRPIGLQRLQGGIFHLPFSKYCGPGYFYTISDINEGVFSFACDNFGFKELTSVLRMILDDTGPTGKLDDACRQHDIAYMLGEDPVTADADFLQSVWATGSYYYYPIWLAIKTKQAFESVTGTAYTSALYVTPVRTKATFAHYFYFKSVLDGFDADSLQLDIIKEKELLWRDEVLDIWRGQCYVQKRPGSDTEAGSGAHLDVNPSTSQAIETNTGIIKPVEYINDDERSIAIELDYPPPPPSMTPCRLVINEILTDDGLSSKSFIEIMKVCPDTTERERRSLNLKDFYVAVLKAADPVELSILIDLNGEELSKVTETTHTSKGLRSKNYYYFVVGSTNVIDKNMNLRKSYGGRNGIPSGTNRDETYSVVLLKSESMSKVTNKYKSALPAQLTDEEVSFFGIALQDIITYGAPCNRARCSVFLKWNVGLLQLDEHTDITPIPDKSDNKIEQSINRCSQNAYPMQQESWESATPSPKQKNQCSVKVDPLYVFKRGCSIQSSAQYVIMNVRNFFHSYKHANIEGLLEGSETELTSKATGVSVMTVDRINKRHQSGTIQTPRGRKRKRARRAICRFSEADKKHIKAYIQSKFESNLPPYFEDIYENVQKYFKDQTPTRTMCGKSTFKKLLYMMGFHYGRINALLVLLERPDIVYKRSVYLKKMKENDRSDNPKPVVYTDESWIDPHARSGKAWVPKVKQFEHEERLKYTYKKHHTNKGKRIILIHAAGPDGLIDNSLEVRDVGGSKNAEDYHDNIESTFYFEWFRKLCVNIQELLGNSIIVIDNAPYHTKSDAPKSGSKKKEMEDYLRKVTNDGKQTGFVNDRKYLRWELWQLVMKYKKENSDHYIIDQLAKDYGHTVFRLPPHQCDLNPIEMLWHLGKDHVRKNNPDQRMETVKGVISAFFATFPPDRWRDLVAHTDRLREEYWRTDKLYDEFLDTHEDQLFREDPESLLEKEGSCDSAVDNNYGPLDCYMHAGSDLAFDGDGEIILETDGDN